MLSAARSLIFNAILAERVAQGSWNRLLPGDVANLDGRGSVFAVPAPDEELAAPLRGARDSPHGAAVRRGRVAVERRGAGARRRPSRRSFPRRWPSIRAERMNAERRALRMRVRDLDA